MELRPLILEPWAIEAMRELIDITALLNDGLFSTPGDLAARIKVTAEAIELVLPTLSPPEDAYTLPDPADYFGTEYLPSPDEFANPPDES